MLLTSVRVYAVAMIVVLAICSWEYCYSGCADYRHCTHLFYHASFDLLATFGCRQQGPQLGRGVSRPSPALLAAVQLHTHMIRRKLFRPALHQPASLTLLR